jgi:hypothetical protein
MRVGLALDLGGGAPGLWEGDALSAAHFLAMAMAGSALVECCVFVHAGQGEPGPDAPRPVMAPGEAMQTLDLVIELGTRLSEGWARDFTARGGLLVAHRLNHDLVADAEAMTFSRSRSLLPAPGFYREVWVWPAHAVSCGSYHHYTMQAPVHVVPQLWNPALIEAAAGGTWHYTPGRKGWRLAILEPNRSATAACHVPLMLCDAAFRRQNEAVESLCIGASAHLFAAGHFGPFVDSLDLVRQGRTTFFDAIPAWAVLGTRADALVSHHWGSGQSWRHYEALHGGFPLIHNAPLPGGCGYRYHDFDPEDGAEQLLAALAHHDEDLAAYRARAGHFLAGLDPAAQVGAYEQRLMALTGKG